MKLKDLIEKLQAFDPELPVVVCGFDEDGYDPLETIDLVRVAKVVERTSHGPLYREAPEGQDDSVVALLLNF